MRACDVIGVYLQFGLRKKLSVVVEQQSLAQLVSVRLLGSGFDQYLALKDADSSIAKNFLEYLPAFTVRSQMLHEERVVLMEIRISDRRP